MKEIFFESLLDTAKILPLLFIIYGLIEFFEYKYGQVMREKVEKAGNAGPAVGAILGSLPQCGFSVISTALFSERLLTIGTLIAVYIATSDEAIPILLSNPKQAGYILPLIGIKVLIAIVAGYIIDVVYKKLNKKTLAHIEEIGANDVCEQHHQVHVTNEIACCGHDPEKPKIKEFVWHPIVHTLKIGLFIFLTTLLIAVLFDKFSGALIDKLFLNSSIFQPVIAALIGLIPNCAASVAISELFLKGTISFGSLVAGLSSSAGLGMLLLFREEKNKKNVWRIVGLLFGVSVFSGILIQLFFG